MAINLTCSCGNTLRVRRENAGQKARCPECRRLMEVPDIDDLPQGASDDGDFRDHDRETANEYFEEGRAAFRPPKQSRKIGWRFVAYYLCLGFLLTTMLLVGGGVAAYLYFVNKKTGLGIHEKYLPDKCAKVQSLNLERFRSNPEYDELKKDSYNSAFALPRQNIKDVFDLGEDDIERLTIAATMEGRVTIVTATKDVSLKEIAVRKDMKEHAVGAFTIYEVASAERPGAEIAIVSPEDHIYIIGSAKLVRAVLERGKAPDLGEKMTKAMGMVNWSKCLAAASNHSLPEINVPEFAAACDASAAELDFSDGLSRKSIFVYADSEAAKKHIRAIEYMMKDECSRCGAAAYQVGRIDATVTARLTMTAAEVRKNKDKVAEQALP
jgi:hypothetical protein